MGITLKYESLKDQNFLSAIRKISNYTGYKDIRFAAGILKFIKKLNEEMTTAQTVYTNLIKQYAKLDEKGEIAQPKDMAPGSFDVPTEKVAEWEAKRKEFESTPFTIKTINKFNVQQLQGVGISPVELLAIEEMLTELEAVASEVPTAETA